SFCGTRQFHVVNTDKNWVDAQKYCRENFTDLATIESQEEMNIVKAALKGMTGDFWIGLKEIPGQSWMWSDGSIFSYTSWSSGQPDNNAGDNCVTAKSDFGFSWNDLRCYWTKNFVCYKDTPLILIEEEKTWREALRYCRENHVDLVSVENETIQRWVKILAKTASTDNVWVGLRHTCSLSFWFWVSGNSICYQNWAAGNGTGEEDCSEVERSGAVQSKSKQWISLLENQTLNFICTTN
ncbi:macrophage mannose receptor 1-like, partial [Astyanax mexicanus]